MGKKQNNRKGSNRYQAEQTSSGNIMKGQKRRLSEAERRRRIRKKRKKRIMKKLFTACLLFLVAFCGVGMVYFGRDVILERMEDYVGINGPDANNILNANNETSFAIVPTETPVPTEAPLPTPTPVPKEIVAGDMIFDGGFEVFASEDTIIPSETEVISANSVLIDLTSDTIVAAKNADIIISPASMTKILTVLVAAENVTDLDAVFTVTGEMTNYCLTNGCSAAGFWGGEEVTIRDLFYGTILPSGGEAAVALATYVGGSHEYFVEMMNQKLEELGLSDTAHFTNCVGLYDENHYCSILDMAMILKAALANDLAREVLSTKVYMTEKTPQNPDGLVLSNWFLRRIEDKDSGGNVIAAKTGFVQESGSCAASYAVSASGKPYICVTVNAHSDWRCIYDHVAMYKLYTS